MNETSNLKFSIQFLSSNPQPILPKVANQFEENLIIDKFLKASPSIVSLSFVRMCTQED